MKLKRLTFALLSAIALMANAQNAVQTVEQVTDTITLNDAVDYTICSKSSFDTWINGHEFFPIFQGTLNDNPKLVGNSANNSTSNAGSLYGPVHHVVNL